MRRTALLLVLLLSAACAHAQVGIYVTSSSTHLSNVQTGDASVGSTFQERYTSFWTSGIGGGVTFNFLPVGPVKFGFDLRGSTRPGTTGADTALAGFKVGFNPPVIPLKPYIQASGGYVGTRTVNVSTAPNNPSQTLGGTLTNRYAAWEILGGVDYPLVKFLDLRLIEVGGGTGINIFGNSSGAPHISLFTINSGIVLHF